MFLLALWRVRNLRAWGACGHSSPGVERRKSVWCLWQASMNDVYERMGHTVKGQLGSKSDAGFNVGVARAMYLIEVPRMQATHFPSRVYVPVDLISMAVMTSMDKVATISNFLTLLMSKPSVGFDVRRSISSVRTSVTTSFTSRTICSQTSARLVAFTPQPKLQVRMAAQQLTVSCTSASTHQQYYTYLHPLSPPPQAPPPHTSNARPSSTSAAAPTLEVRATTR